MKLLLDTNALIWWLTDPAKLSATARKVIESDDSSVCISAAAV
jgi:PIN domain nuclease of toxin-antitoxin system